MEKLLIVDDEEIELDGMSKLINWNKYDFELVGTAINGQEGLELIREKHPDIVVTDIKMPVMDGLQLIAAVQAEGLDVQFVVLSGYGDYEYTSQAMQMGIRHYILKPCNENKIMPVLLKAREELLARRTAEQHTHEMEYQVHRMEPIAREKMLRILMQEQQPTSRTEAFAQTLGHESGQVALVALHCEEGIDHLEQYAIANMMADLLPEGSVLGDTSVSRDVFLLVDAAVYEQLPTAIERLCMELSRFGTGTPIVVGSGRGSLYDLHTLYDQAVHLLKAIDKPGKLVLFENLDENQNYAACYVDYEALRNAEDYGQLCFECCLMLLYMKLHSMDDRQMQEACVWVLRYLCDTNAVPQGSDYASLLRYLVDEIWTYRAKDDEKMLGKAQRTEQLILREFYANLPDKNFTMQIFSQDKLFMNPDYLSRKLQQLTGERFAVRLTADRVALAQRLLLQDPFVRMAALAKAVGFAPDEQYFSRAFRKFAGKTPREYADELRKKKKQTN